MFLRQARGLLDFALAVIAVWAAAYHTPLGAGVRALSAEFLGWKTTARPLLAYYSGGVDPFIGLDRQDPAVPKPPPPPVFRLSGTVPAAEAMGYGAHAALTHASPQARANAASLATRYGVDAALLSDARAAPAALSKIISGAGRELGSVEAGVLALFLGHEPARYAQERAMATGGKVTLEALARHLPPGMDEQLSLSGKALALGSAYGLSWPVPEDTRITSTFGWRMHPVLGTKKLHTGVDLSVPVGTEVHATAAGRVRRASEDAVNGRVLVIEHDHGVTTAYCHNSQLLVGVGDRVTVGQVISHSGNTGRSTGPHLHYQLELSGTPMDPVLFRAETSGVASGTGL